MSLRTTHECIDLQVKTRRIFKTIWGKMIVEIQQINGSALPRAVLMRACHSSVRSELEQRMNRTMGGVQQRPVRFRAVCSIYLWTTRYSSPVAHCFSSRKQSTQLFGDYKTRTLSHCVAYSSFFSSRTFAYVPVYYSQSYNQQRTCTDYGVHQFLFSQMCIYYLGIYTYAQLHTIVCLINNFEK